MAYDAALAERVREVLALRESVSEREMFGGICFMVAGNMACGVIGEELIVRLTEDDARRALDEPDTRPFDMTGKPMRKWVMVSPDGLGSEEELASWVDAGADFATSLPPK